MPAWQVKCLELEEVLEEQGLKEDEIEEKVSAYRKMLISKEGEKKMFAEVDEFGRPVYKEHQTHLIAEAQKEKNARLKDAFGISQHFVEGSSFDGNRRELEEAAREEARNKRREEEEAPRREREREREEWEAKREKEKAKEKTK
jgi:serine/arginine repetitive matrix protein 2